MSICDFCVQLRTDGTCRLGLDRPKRMSCREFDPTIERFCANPADFVSSAQLLQMCTYFDIKGAELKKIKIMAARAEEDRTRARLAPPDDARTEAGETI